jgi:ChrB-like protein
MAAGSWLVLIYRVPSEPTRHRAMLWRRLRNLGAVYLQHSAVALPHTDDHERALRALRAEIVQKMAGKAYLLSATAMAGEADIVATLNAARDDEYDEILDKCVDFHAGLAKEVAAEHFTYGELEENEEDLAKLMRWYDKVKARDSLQAGRRADVDKALQDCARALEEFAAQVYAADADS